MSPQSPYRPGPIRRRKGYISTILNQQQQQQRQLQQQGRGISGASAFFKGQVIHIEDDGDFEQPVSVKNRSIDMNMYVYETVKKLKVQFSSLSASRYIYIYIYTSRNLMQK
jgi:hypothetical protein